VRDGDQFIDVSSAASGSSSTIPIGAMQQKFPFAGTVYQFDQMLFHNSNATEFDLSDAEDKLFSLMKSHNTVDGCKMVRHRVHKVVTCCNRKRG